MKEMFQSLMGRLRIAAFLEGCSYLAFGITMPLKYGLDIHGPNYVVGLFHGILFMTYVGLVLFVGYKRKWKLSTIFWSLLASIIPFGTFIADKKIFSKEEA
ncbi:MAG: DUF3817 domain-containing protein [Bacteroidia bacterium]|nr:DUF3817 domain-containing protein [Bacteroidia bacterium]